jgi:hypothetical protein
MSRALSTACVRVSAAHRDEWLATVGRLAALLGARGHHLWVFQSERDPESWLEFIEAGDRSAHPLVAARSPEELGLTARLRQLARYEPDHSTLWAEVPLPKER